LDKMEPSILMILDFIKRGCSTQQIPIVSLEDVRRMGNKTRFKALNRAIRADIDLVNQLEHDQNNRRARNKIPSAGTLQSSNLLGHRKPPIRIRNNTLIGGRLRKRDCRA
jgi:hypothetical protein